MKLRFAIGSAVAMLALSSGAMADPPAAQAGGDDKSTPASQNRRDTPTADAIVQIAALSEQIGRVASTTIAALPAAEIIAPPVAETNPPAEASVAPDPAPVKDAVEPAESTSANAPAIAPPSKHAKDKLAAKVEQNTKRAARHNQVAAAELKPLCVRAIGKPETGTAAWYGGRYIGRRTSSGERLDTIHPTAAHRTLPLNSLARVTNLHNGRSVVVRVTDRGPVADSLLIDMSPRAADELHMKEAGLVPVRVEQVVEVPPDRK